MTPAEKHVLRGETAVVTGAGRGIGRQIALDLAAAGASVGLVSRTANQLEDVASEICMFGDQRDGGPG